MSELFDTSIQNINLHVLNIFDNEKLDENSTIKDFLIVQYVNVKIRRLYNNENNKSGAYHKCTD